MAKDKQEDKKGVLGKDKSTAQTNPVEESKDTATATTDDGRTVSTAGVVAVGENAPDVSEQNDEDNPNRELTGDEQAELVGELTLGEKGWLPLNEEGFVTGPARRGQAPEGQHFAAVQCTGEGNFRGRGLTTPSGAPVLRKMNPDVRIDEDHNRNARDALETGNTVDDERDESDRKN